MSEEKTKQARKGAAQQGEQGEQGQKESAAFQSDSKEEQHTTAAPDMGGAGTGTGTGAGGSETGGSKKPKKKAEGTAAGGKGTGVGAEKKSGKSPPISGHPAEAGYVRREQDSPGA